MRLPPVLPPGVWRALYPTLIPSGPTWPSVPGRPSGVARARRAKARREHQRRAR